MKRRAAALSGNTRRVMKVKCSGANGTSSEYTGQAFTIQTYNAISEAGLKKFPEGRYEVSRGALSADAMALMLRSHKLKVEEVPSSCRCVARCGAGTNNIPVKELTQMV